MPAPWPLARSLFPFVLLFSLTAWWSAHKHYALPTPVGPVPRNHSRPSEAHILAVARHLSENIGYRTVGTREHAEGDAWLLHQVRRIKDECDHIVQRVHKGRHLQCEVWRQQGSGHHRFDIMGYRLYKTYVDLSNIIVRLSNGTDPGKEHAILVNAHLDSTPPSPGAADDALPVGVMLECIRVLIHSEDWEPSHAIVFLFNNAEESLQDGSHLYSTQHPTANTVRGIINLEAAGTRGPELLFQATSDAMIEAYATVPRPYGTVLANDVFSSGIILSDTDFRQFQQYLNVTGLDMAIVGHSYFYHTQKDLVEYIEPGVAQHMADNTLALLQYFTAPHSPLATLASTSSLPPPRPRLVYFSLLGSVFVTFSFLRAVALYTAFLGAALALVWETRQNVPHMMTPKKSGSATVLAAAVARGARNYIVGYVCAIVCANAVAAVMKYVLVRGMSWFSREWLPIMLYGPPAFLGALLPQLLFMAPYSASDEHATLSGALILYSSFATVLQAVYELGSAVFFFVSAVPLFLAVLLSAAQTGMVTYLAAGIVPVLIGTELWCGVADVFVPLTGRMGEKAPAEFIIATMASLCILYTFPLLIPFAHRAGAGATRAVVSILAALSVAAICILAVKSPYDTMHPKRLFVVHSENITTGEVHLNFAGADSAPGLLPLVKDLAGAFGAAEQGSEYELSVVDMNDWNGDWDTLYPFSAFLTPYKILLPNSTAVSAYDGKFTVTAENDVVDLQAGTRSLTLRVDHSGVIWTVIAFDAHVLRWSLDNNPPPHFARHHVKEASFYGVDSWSIDLVIRIPPVTATANASAGDNEAAAPVSVWGDSGLKVNFVGTKEAVQWPAKQKWQQQQQQHGGGIGGEELKMLSAMHAWLDSTSGGAIDAMLFGTVGGVVVV